MYEIVTVKRAIDMGPLPDYISSIEDVSDQYITRARIKFKNGLQLSVIRGWGTYGASHGLFEIAVFNENEDYITTEAPLYLGDDAVGHFTPEDIKSFIEKIGNFIRKIENNGCLLL